MTPNANPAYEDAYKRLEDAVAELSAGGLSLEEALARFEQGIALANYCSTLLDRAELRVQQVGQLAPEDLAALIDGDAPPPAAAPSRGSGSAPAQAAAPAPPRGPLTGPPIGGRRGLPPVTGPQRRPSAEDSLDPLFDEI